MTQPTIQCKRLVPEAIIPTQAHEGDAGYDLHSIEDATIPRGHVRRIQTGISVAIPKGYVGIIKDRSGMASRGFTVFGGVIDSNYRGDVSVLLANFDNLQIRSVLGGSRIAQLVVVPCLSGPMQEVDSLDETDRGTDGFGSTGE